MAHKIYGQNVVVIGGGEAIEDIATVAEMDALLTAENAGKIYRFIGETDGKYTNGNLYEVTKNSISVDPIFANNSPSVIRSVFRSGQASQYWKVGDTKSITSKSGKTYTLRIADMTAGRYNLADGSGTTNGVLEFVELYNLNGKTAWAINGTQKEGYWAGGGYAMSDMANIYLPQIFADLPDEWQEIISEITLNEYSYTSPSPRSGNHKLFLPAETEMFDARYYSAEGYMAGCPKYTQFEYYAENNTDAARVKKDIGSTSGRLYRLRSPYWDSTGRFCVVYDDGRYSHGSADRSYGVAPCFAI